MGHRSCVAARIAACLLLVVGVARAGTFDEPGPYPVGVRTLVLVDESREDPLTGGARTLVTEVWYPAVEEARGGRAVGFSEFFGSHRAAAEAVVERFGKDTLEDVDARFRSRAVRDAAARAGRFPLLVFSHGNGGLRHQNVFQMDHLASHGYVVASPDHTGNAAVSPLPTGAVPYDRKGRTRSAKDRPADVSFVITRLLGLSAETEGWVAGRIDAERIGALGHSFGGYTVCRVAESDPRVKAIVPMTVAYGPTTSKPVLVMLAERDRTMGPYGNAAARLYFKGCSGPKHLVSLVRAGHFSYTDMDAIHPAFGDGIGVDTKTGEAFLPVDRAKSAINGYTLAFFERYLRGAAEAQRFLERAIDADEMLVSYEPASADRPTDAAVAASESVSSSPSGGPADGEKPTPAASTAEKRRVLIVTGDDVPKHDWRATTAVTRATLDEDGRFETFVCEDARILESSAALGTYDAIVLNYRNPPNRDPGEAARENLAAFVRGGGGLVVLHFAVYAFPEWEEYRQVLGRVWVGRASGQKVSGHPPKGPFPVRVVDEDHPATKGVSSFTIDDELSSKLQGDAPIHVLLDAYSSYSESVEPVSWTHRYGEGRVLVNTLGHDVESRSHPAFRRLLVEGLAWVSRRSE